MSVPRHPLPVFRFGHGRASARRSFVQRATPFPYLRLVPCTGPRVQAFRACRPQRCRRCGGLRGGGGGACARKHAAPGGARRPRRGRRRASFAHARRQRRRRRWRWRDAGGCCALLTPAALRNCCAPFCHASRPELGRR
eukprot:120414-Chlamydomonas_euryale.AAC.1